MISIDEARRYYHGAESAHDFDHVLRVLALAERLAHAEGADVEIVRAAVLLHDVARTDEDEQQGDDHAHMAAKRARALLLARGIPPARAEAVAHAIAAHRFRGTTQPQTLEAQVVFDADKLDSLGAIGVARAYAVAGALHQRLWGETAPDAVTMRGERNAEQTPVAEFVVKLSQLRERMHTPTARAIAEERQRFMAEFFARLEHEVRGEM